MIPIPDIRGSILGVNVIRVPNAFAARVLNRSLDVSAKDFAKVRCNCGKNGFKYVGIFCNSELSVSKIAATTF